MRNGGLKKKKIKEFYTAIIIESHCQHFNIKKIVKSNLLYTYYYM